MVMRHTLWCFFLAFRECASCMVLKEREKPFFVAKASLVLHPVGGLKGDQFWRPDYDWRFVEISSGFMVMIPLPSSLKIWLSAGATAMWRGVPGLALRVQQFLGKSLCW